MDIQTQLNLGIKAAKNGDKVTARTILYSVLDIDPRNEMAWVWLSYVVETVEDCRICLENVLVVNPKNEYALKRLAQLKTLTTTQPPSSSSSAKIKPKPQYWSSLMKLVIAFWFGIGFLFLGFGIVDLIDWSITLAQSRTFPSYITSYELATLALSVTFIILGIIMLNIAWAIYKKQKIGYIASIVFSLGLALVGPITLLILENPNYLLAMFTALMPAIVLFLTLLSQAGFADDQQLASYPGRN